MVVRAPIDDKGSEGLKLFKRLPLGLGASTSGSAGGAGGGDDDDGEEGFVGKIIDGFIDDPLDSVSEFIDGGEEGFVGKITDGLIDEPFESTTEIIDGLLGGLFGDEHN